MYDFSVGYNSIGKPDILNIHIYLTTKNNKMFNFIKQLFIGLLSFSSSSTTKCVSLNDEPCIIRPNLMDLHPVEVKYYPFMISLDNCTISCNVYPQKYVSNKTKDINVLKHLIW